MGATSRVRPAWRPFPFRPWVGRRRPKRETERVQGVYDRDTGRPYTGKGALNKPNVIKAKRA